MLLFCSNFIRAFYLSKSCCCWSFFFRERWGIFDVLFDSREVRGGSYVLVYYFYRFLVLLIESYGMLVYLRVELDFSILVNKCERIFFIFIFIVKFFKIKVNNFFLDKVI